MPTFLTVKDAAKLVNKSPSAIRRIIYPIIKDDQHSDRNQIQPSPEKVRELRIRGENFPWKISEKLLRRAVPEESSREGTVGQATAAKNAADITTIDLLRDENELLRGELTIKNKQLEAQTELMKGLSERLREDNIILASFQKLLPIAAEPSRNNDIVEANTKKESEKGSDDSPPKKTHWLFRKIF